MGTTIYELEEEDWLYLVTLFISHVSHKVETRSLNTCQLLHPEPRASAFGYEESLQKQVSKAGSSVGGTIGKWLHHSGASFINEFVLNGWLEGGA